MHIGELAGKATVNIQTIRFYERKKLIPSPARNSSGYRCYDAKDLERVKFIRRNQELGFTLAEIKELVDLHNKVAAMQFPLRRKPSELQGIISIGRERLDVINQKIKTLHTMRKQLGLLLRQLQSPTVMTCPASASTSRGMRRQSAGGD